jgi:hypothetical protein
MHDSDFTKEEREKFINGLFEIIHLEYEIPISSYAIQYSSVLVLELDTDW